MSQFSTQRFLSPLEQETGDFNSNQKGNEEASLHNSLRNQLTDLIKKTRDYRVECFAKEALALYTTNKIDDSLADELLQIDGLLLQKSKNNPESVLYAEALILVFQQLPPQNEHPYYATSLEYLANLYKARGQNEKALPLLEQAVAIRKLASGEESAAYITCLRDLADLYQDMGQYEKALTLLIEASSLTLNYLTRTYTSLSEQEKIMLLDKETTKLGYLPSLLITQNINIPF